MTVNQAVRTTTKRAEDSAVAVKKCWAGFDYEWCSEHPGWRDCEPYCETCGEHFGLCCEGCEVTLDSVWNRQMDRDEADWLRIVAVHPATHETDGTSAREATE